MMALSVIGRLAPCYVPLTSAVCLRSARHLSDKNRTKSSGSSGSSGSSSNEGLYSLTMNTISKQADEFKLTLYSLAMNTISKQADEFKLTGVSFERISVNGLRLHYAKSGIGNHVLLLLPGALGSSQTDFAPQLSGLNKEKFCVISFDPRGYGRSIPPERDWPLEYLQRDAEDAVQLMKKLSVKKFSVLGWSDGGISGLILAGRYPDLVHRLVVWGSNAYIAPGDIDIFKGISNIDTWSTRMRDPFIEVYGEKYFRSQWQKWIEAYCRYYYERQGDICKGDLKNIICPTLIIHGEKDPLVIKEHPNYLHENIKNSRLHLMPEGKHNLHLRFAKEFNQMVENFLQES